MRHSHITKYRDGLRLGCSKFFDMDETTQNTGMSFSIHTVDWKVSCHVAPDQEAQLIVLSGEGSITVDGQEYTVERKDVFRAKPHAFSLAGGTSYVIESDSARPLEVALIETGNKQRFDPVVLSPDDIPSEQRGEGLLDGTMHRVVRAIFGDPQACERGQVASSNLVVGEVVNFSGRWSSYPPHYHPHPEAYYYRFDRPEGYGISLIDDPPVMVKMHDVVKILNCTGHAQVAPPGYPMWYLWFIRHLPQNRYEGDPPFTFFPEHEWTLDPRADLLIPADVP